MVLLVRDDGWYRPTGPWYKKVRDRRPVSDTAVFHQVSLRFCNSFFFHAGAEVNHGTEWRVFGPVLVLEQNPYCQSRYQEVPNLVFVLLLFRI